MNKTNLIFALFIIFAFSFVTCSKKGADKIIGKWKVDKIEEMEKVGIKLEMTYEFKKDIMVIEGSINNEPQPKIETTYIIKSDDGTNLILEVLHPESKVKGEFKVKLDGNKMILTDPNNQITNLTKL